VNRINVVFLCLMLCLAGITMSTGSTTVLTTSTKTTFTSCQQQVSLMRDTYQNVFAKYKITVPADTKVSAARTMAATAADHSNTGAVVTNLEQSTTTVMTQRLQSADNHNVASVKTLTKTTSLESHTRTFAAEQTSVATTPTTSSTTPAQVVALKAPVALTPSARPFPAPVTTRTVTVPASIDATGATDVSTTLTNFILSVPDGATINFPAASIYRIDRAIFLEHRHNLILDGNGCTLKYASVTGTTGAYSFWYPEGAGSDIWIRNFVLIGSSTNPGVYTPGTSPTGGEGQMGVIISGNRFEVSGCTISKVWGDGFYTQGGPSDVWIHDNHVISAGRNGLSVISGTNVIAERNAFDKVGLSAFDVEPNVATESCTNIIFRLNTIGTYGTPALFTPYAFSADSTAKAVIDGIVVDGNTVTGNSIATNVDSVGTVRMTRITFTNNKGGKAVAGAVIYFKHVDGLTITGNVQPLSSSVPKWITDCTGVVTS